MAVDGNPYGRGTDRRRHLAHQGAGACSRSSRGAAVYADVCSVCHGADGVGQRAPYGAGYQIPPLWGPDSYNNGAGMNRVLTAAAYAMHNMPFGATFTNPVLTDEEAYDVAAYIVSKIRPQKRDLDKDF